VGRRASNAGNLGALEAYNPDLSLPDTGAEDDK